jgi:hypothetical protein
MGNIDANLPAVLDDFRVLSVREWCALNNISLRTGRRLIASPDGPRVTRISTRRVGVTIANNRAWQASRERAS